MNASMGMSHNETEVSYAVDFGRDREPMQKRSRHPQYRRQGAAPARVGGMHCRRNKRWTWGSGRGARMANARHFMGVLALAVASVFTLATQAATITGGGLTFNAVTVAGGTGTPAPSGYGVVTDTFNIATNEVTNAQYAAFLNATGAPNNTFVSGGQISLVSGTYVVASGKDNFPVTNVSWFSAARFVNWMVSGSTEAGAYTLSGSNTVVSRTPGATIFLPNVNEWYKAAYYNPNTSTWNTYAVTGTPNSSSPAGNASSANYSNVMGTTVAVGSYTSATSVYGTFDQLGNVAEILETSAPWNSTTGIMRTGGNWLNNAPSASNSSTVLSGLDPSFYNAQIGFRIAAVPEPGTIALAGMGIAGLAGLDWMKRRKKRMAARHEG